MTKVVCDICGKEIPTSIYVDAIKNFSFSISSRGKIWDVCGECRESLKEWITIRNAKRESESEQ